MEPNDADAGSTPIPPGTTPVPRRATPSDTPESDANVKVAVFRPSDPGWNRTSMAQESPEATTEPGVPPETAIKPAKALKPGMASIGTAPASLAARTEEVDMLRRLKWVALAAVPSSMMLGVTSHITTDLSPIPLFWLVPLALYLLSFILVFARWPVVWTESPHLAMVYLQPFAIAFMILGSLPFVLYIQATNGHYRPLFTDAQVHWFLVIIVIFVGAITAWLVIV